MPALSAYGSQKYHTPHLHLMEFNLIDGDGGDGAVPV